MTRRRSVVVALALTLLGGVLGGCGSPDKEDINELRSAIRATRSNLSGFVYSEIADGREIEVRGIVEDDFRYEARLSINKEPAFDEIVSDDALADRVLHPDALEIYAPEGLPSSASQADDGQISVQAAFETKRWVLDPAGAPDLLGGRDTELEQGNDPIFDALATLDYLEFTVLRQNAVKKFDEFDLEYKPAEDPFPTPEKGSGVDRFDIRPPRLPRATDAAGGGDQPVPTIGHFRKMAIYVKDGEVIRILENIDVISRLDEIQRNYDIEFPPDVTTEEAAAVSIDAINAVRRGQGDEAIRVRVMSITYRDEEAAVELPAKDVVPGDLSVLESRGVKGGDEEEEEDVADAPKTAGETSGETDAPATPEPTTP